MNKKLCLFLAVLTFLSAGPALGQVSGYDQQLEQQYGPEYFFAIQGEVMGQAAPGVQSVKINGEAVAVDKDLNFKARVTLADGQKYLSIETTYKGLRFTKKYLVIRHPKAPKTFKISIPRSEFQKIVTRKQPARRTTSYAAPKPKPKPAISFGFKGAEFENSRYDIKKLAQAVEADNYSLALKSKPGTLAWLNELLRTPNFYDIWKKKHPDVFLSEDAKRLIKETAGYRNKPWNKLTREQQLKIIRLNRLLLEATYPLLCPKSQPEGETAEENWLGFDFVAEIEPGLLLVVRHVDGKYFAAIYDLPKTLWLPLHDLSSDELADLLEKGKVPVLFLPVDD
ncbi:MAG: hypothetical protein JW782_06820 [Candidatus Saganbacteria bacterium]|nr:hypothetical protein [Candidatus Saganbacteria bacterium]